ncbi:MAG: hypothetical protein KYX62_16155 [Pseudomonadota bacterium]|nr:hypothetical protein [Pseudomonadota bacterium]
MANSSDGFDKEKTESILKKIAEDNINGVVLFAVRTALRILPLIADQQGNFRFRENSPLHAMAIWRALYLSLTFHSKDPSTVYSARVAAAATAAARAADDDAAAAIYTVAAGDFLNELNNDLSLLQQNALNIQQPLWRDKNFLEKDVQYFITGCKKHNLDPIIDDYQALLKGGPEAQAVADQPWDKYEELWNRLSGKDSGSASNLSDQSQKISEFSSEVESSDEINSPEIDIDRATYQFHPGSRNLADKFSDEDHLNRKTLINAIYSWLEDKENSHHIAFGLFGDWGAGKSTFLNLLKKKLLPDKDKTDSGEVKFIWGEYNAWQYEHSGNIQAGIAQEVVTALVKGMSLPGLVWLTLRYVLKKYPCRLAGSFIAVLLSIAIWYFGREINISKDGVPEVILGASAQVVIGLFLLKQIKTVLSHPLAKELKTYLRLPDFGKYLGTIPVIREQIEKLVELRLSGSFHCFNFFRYKSRIKVNSPVFFIRTILEESVYRR